MQNDEFADNSSYGGQEQAETHLLRVLWMTSQGMVWPWLLNSLCRRDAIQHALAARLLWAPVGEHLGYHITDAGRRLIVDWYEENGPGKGRQADTRQWRAVTLR